MARPPNKEIAICGAGLAGLGMALALHSQNIPCKIYEAMETPERFGGGSITLGPNAMTVFDRYGVLDRLQSPGYPYERLKIKNGKSEPLSELVSGDRTAYGYTGLRITRRFLVKELTKVVRERGISIECSKRLLHVVDESHGDSVQLTFSDGTVAHAAMLVAADGIYSRTRRQLFPDVEPAFLNGLIIGGTLDRSDILDALSDKDAISDCHGMFLGAHGMFLLVPENSERSVYMAILQRPHQDIGRAGWEGWLADKSKVDAFCDETREDWPDFIRANMEKFKSKLDWYWPIRSLPRLEEWKTASSRIVLIGDAAHAMPPAAGQGANMAFEDGYAMALVLAQMKPNITIREAMAFWQQIRQERVDSVLELTEQLNKMRLPQAERENLAKGQVFEAADTETGRLEQLRWLYQGVPAQEKKIQAWASGLK